MKKCGIYGIHNTANGKWYIGQSVNIYGRRQKHFWALLNSKHYNGHLQASFDKYGSGCFEFHVLEITPDNMLDIRERAWISFYRSNQEEYGYNLEPGGCDNKSHSIETRRKMSMTRKGCFPTEETKRKMSLAQQGRVISLEHRKKISESMMGKKRPLTSLAARLNLSRALTGRILSEEHRKNISASKTNRSLSEEELLHLKSMSENNRGNHYAQGYHVHHTPEAKAKISKAQLGHSVSAETRRKISQSNIKSWQNRRAVNC